MSLPQLQRYRPGTDFLSFGDRTPDVAPETVTVTAGDGVSSRSVLYARGDERTVVCLMHPRADMTRHYSIPDIVGNGYAFYAQQGRFPGADVSAPTIHEPLLADVAAGLQFLRSRGFANIVLLGNSGAGPLYALYHAQATTAPPGRLTDTAAGDPFDLNGLEMPVADGFIFLGAHPGPGQTLQASIDPSVIDESDPLSCDPELDMFDARNGFKEPPAYSTYSEDFLTRYRAAQQIRASRLDAIAWSLVHEQRHAEAQMDAPAFDGLDYPGRSSVMRRAVKRRLMQIHRLDADPASMDLSIVPSDRGYGSLMSLRPDIANFGMLGTKVLSPHVWLSSWSARYSRASLFNCLPSVTLPSLVLDYTGDNSIAPDVSAQIYRLSPATDKVLDHVPGDHFGYRLEARPNEGGREAALKVIIGWLRDRFPSVR